MIIAGAAALRDQRFDNRTYGFSICAHLGNTADSRARECIMLDYAQQVADDVEALA